MWGASGGQLVVELRVTGPVSGRIWLSGTPQVDEEGGTVRFPDLELFLAEGSVLARLAMGSLRPRLTRLAKEQIALATDEVSPAGEGIPFQDLSRPLTPELRLEGSVGSLELHHIQASAGALLLQSRVESHLQLKVDGA